MDPGVKTVSLKTFPLALSAALWWAAGHEDVWAKSPLVLIQTILAPPAHPLSKKPCKAKSSDSLLSPGANEG